MLGRAAGSADQHLQAVKVDELGALKGAFDTRQELSSSAKA
jgi:hypothetical protein